MKKYKSKILLLTILIIFLFGTNVKAVVRTWDDLLNSLCLAHNQPFRRKTGCGDTGTLSPRYPKGKGKCTWSTWEPDYDDDGNSLGTKHEVPHEHTFTASDFQISDIPITNNYSLGARGKINVGFGCSTNDLTVGYMLSQSGGYKSALQYWVWAHISMVQRAMKGRSAKDIKK